MAVPGLSFDIVRTSAPMAMRADQTAIIALTERGPVETPTLVHGLDEFTNQFGSPLPGTLGALAAQGYYDNGGQQLIVARFVPAEAQAAVGGWPVVGVDPNRSSRAFFGQLNASASPTVFTMTALTPSVLPSDVNTPMTLVLSPSAPAIAATITGVMSGGSVIALATGAPIAALSSGSVAVTMNLPASIPLIASGPGAFGNSVQVQTTLNLRRRAGGSLAAVSSTGAFQINALSPVVLPSDACTPARLIFGGTTLGSSATVLWGTVTSVGTGGVSLVFTPGPIPQGAAPTAFPVNNAIVEVYDPTFAITILEPARANVVVSGLDLRDLATTRALLAGTSVTIPPLPGEVPLVPGAPLPPPELPVPGIVSLYGGVDGISPLSPDATTATASIPTVGVTFHALPFVLPLEADAPGAQGNGAVVTTSLDARRCALGEVVRVDATGALHVHGLMKGDEGSPALLEIGTPAVAVWGKVQAPTHGHHPLFVPSPSASPLPAPLPQRALIHVYQPTFTVAVTTPSGHTTTVSGLDLRDIDAARSLLAITGVTIPPGVQDSMDIELPVAESVTLANGSNGTPLADRVVNLAASFQRCVDALEAADQPPTLPDVMIAPDLWSRIWGTKGVSALAFDCTTAKGLADQMVLSAWRTSDRVVLLDPPLHDDLQPYAPSDLVAWQAQRYAMLGPSAASGPLVGLTSAGTDFAATFTPWVEIVAGGTYRGDDTLLVPPSAYVAGQMAVTARNRGPWIATGNVALEDIVGLDQQLAIQDQEALQAVGISPLRLDLPMGVTIQGVRSLSWPSRLAWGYLSTRRLFNFLRRALTPLGLSYVFQPNTPVTWLAIRRDITRLLRDIFLAGGLAGSKPSDAFYVKMDSTNNPQSAIDAGIMTARIAVAPAIPLEFLVVLLVLQENTASVTEAPP